MCHIGIVIVYMFIGKTLVLLAIEGGAKNSFVIYRPNTGLQPHEDIKSDLMNKYRRIATTVAQPLWEQTYNSSLQSCMHGSACKAGKQIESFRFC